MNTREVFALAHTAVSKAIAGLDDWATPVGEGADGTPTVAVDHAAEVAVLSVLEDAGVGWNVLSEEIGSLDRGSELTLLLDPIDGTSNALHGIPIFSLSMALTRNGLQEVEEAFVGNLVNGAVYHAIKGEGATKDGRPIRVRPVPDHDRLFLVYIGRKTSDRGYALTRLGARVRSLGSSALEMCLVAEGMADLFHYADRRPGEGIRIIDIAASTLILREAGGEVYDGNRREVLQMKADLGDRKDLLALGDRSLLGELP